MQGFFLVLLLKLLQLLGAFNQEKELDGTLFVILKTDGSFAALFFAPKYRITPRILKAV